MPTEKELTDDIFFDNSVFVEKKMSKESSKRDQIYKPQNEKTSNEELKDGVALVLSNKNEAIVIESLDKYEADTNLLNELNVPEPDTANSGTEIYIEALPEILDSNHQVEDIKPSITLKNSSSQENTYKSHVNNKEILKNIRGILMTPKTFLSIPENVKIQKFNDFKIDTKEKLEMVVDLIFVKAASDLVFSLEYAKICHWIIDYLKKSVIDLTSNEEVTFNRILINKCQEFELLLDKSKTLNIESELWYSETFGKLCFIVDLFKSKIHNHGKEDSDHTKAYHQEDLDHTKAKEDPQFEKTETPKLENACIQSDDFIKDLQRKEQKEKDELTGNMRGILNKLTPHNFLSLLNKVNELKIDTKERLEIATDLIFEKAVSEPEYSAAYANLCHRLVDCFEAPMTDNTNGKITFKRILLNKCQNEFDKDTSNEEKVDEGKTFDSEAESKLWKTEFDERIIMNRRRMFGNIRFIGELFKLKMISENIMHDCVIKLLKCEKVESAEDQLECLCKLLATIGKDLDHPKAKFRIDQYFAQMSKIIDRKKLSTRIKFAIMDIIDLRSCSWVPRRDDSNPRTIAQIHKEAKDDEKEMEKTRQKDKMRPKQRGAQRSIGRDSPAMRGNVTGPPSSADGGTNIPSKSKYFPATAVDASKFNKKPKDGVNNKSQQQKFRTKDEGNQRSIGYDSPAMRGVAWPPSFTDGWTNITSRSKNVPATPVNASRFKIAKKDDSDNISIEHGGYRSNWSRGASGGSLSSYGALTINEPVQHRQETRYDLLNKQVQLSGFDSKHGSRGSNTSRSSGGKSNREDRIAVIRAVQNISTNKYQFSKHIKNNSDSPRSGA